METKQIHIKKTSKAAQIIASLKKEKKATRLSIKEGTVSPLPKS